MQDISFNTFSRLLRFHVIINNNHILNPFIEKSSGQSGLFNHAVNVLERAKEQEECARKT
jgi:hypothetical protein